MNNFVKKNIYWAIGVALLSSTLAVAENPANPYKAPLYWNPYEYNIVDENGANLGYIPEAEWSANIDWMEANLLSYGYKMICIDGWGDDSMYNTNGYRLTHSKSWTHDYAWWSKELQNRGMTLGMYYNPLWINQKAADAGVLIKGTNIKLSTLIDNTENALFFKWVQVDRPGAEAYVKGYIQFYADMGVRFLRVDFLSWFEDGKDKGSVVGVTRPHDEYVTALRWMREACDANNMFLSLVMPHLNNNAFEEQIYGHMIRINEDAGKDAGWYRFNDLDRGVKRAWWSQYANPFDGYIYWSSVAERGKMILDGDFIRLNKFSNDDEKRTVISLNLIAGGPISIADQYNSIGNNLWLYQNKELLALNEDGFVGKPLSNDPTKAESQIWTGQLTNGDWIVALFNRENTTQDRYFDYTKLNLTLPSVRDLWEKTEQGTHAAAFYQIPAHGCKILKLKAKSQTAIYCAGTFNNWTSRPMVFDGTNWRIENIQLAAMAYELKFANTTNFSGFDWGNTSGLMGKAEVSTGGAPNLKFTIPKTASYTILFNDITLQYSIVPTISTVLNSLKENSAFIYPNPISNVLHIDIATPNPHYSIFTLTGTKILESNGKEVNVSMLQKGIYIIIVEGNTFRFMKE